MNLDNVLEMLAKHDLVPNTKNLSQHFIINPSVLDSIVNEADIQPREVVMEIGAGIGNITELLAQQSDRVVAFEIDRRMQVFLDPLKRRYRNLEICYQDAKRARWPNFHCLVANIPFNVLEPMMARLARGKFSRAVLVIGDRLRSTLVPPCKEITRLGVMVQAFFSIQEICLVPREDFYPAPSTDASVISLRRGSPTTSFLRVCSKLLMSPTRMVSHVLENRDLPKSIRGDKKSLEWLLNRRADTLTNSDFQNLFKLYQT